MKKLYIAPRTENETIMSQMVMQTTSPTAPTTPTTTGAAITDESTNWGN